MKSQATLEHITGLLEKVRSGDRDAESVLFPIVYGELHRMARIHMRSERSDHTLQPTALVHEAYLRSLGKEKNFRNRSHFFAIASLAMRQILVDHARAASAGKRGGGAIRIDLKNLEGLPDSANGAEQNRQLLALDGELTRLRGLDERQSRIVEMRFFGGMTDEEIAEALGISPRTVRREWTLARAWLHSQLSS